MYYDEFDEYGWVENSFYERHYVAEEDELGMQPTKGKRVFAPVWDPEKKEYGKRRWIDRD